MSGGLLLQTVGLCKRFGGLQAVRDLDLEVRDGTVCSLIGPNGAGKTTVFNCLTQLVEPSSGAVILGGERIDGLLPDMVAAAGLSRTYQNIRLFRNMTVRENVLVGMHLNLPRSTWWGALLGLAMTRREEREARGRADELLAYVGLRGLEDRVASSLPYGGQRRLEIARALATRPRVLLLDEPAAGMNAAETAEMAAFVRGLRDERGVTVLLIEHHMRMVMGVSDHVVVLDHGVKIADGTPAEVRRDPDVIRAYLGNDLGEPGAGAGSVRVPGAVPARA